MDHSEGAAHDQALDFADIAGAATYSLRARSWSREQFFLTPGVQLSLPANWEMGLNAGIRAGDQERTAVASVQVRKEY